MSTLDPTQITTAEQLLRHSQAFEPCELVRGELIVMTPAGAFHGKIARRLLTKIGNHIDVGNLGELFPGDTGFLLETSPDTVRSPDIAFVCAERMPVDPVEGFFPVPPDLAVEIRSPSDRNAEVLSKISQYLATGVQVVWDVNPKSKTVTIYRQQSEQVLKESDILTEETLLPGLSIDVKSLFVW